MSNFVHVGRVSLTGRRGAEDVDVVVGVRADHGEVVLSVDGCQSPVPPLNVDQAQRLATLVASAATKASELAAAYRTYQSALQAAEDAFAEATRREVGA
ncbi:hypothetical protein SEA_AMGINE_58 [Mycobacterium phage Amgine]|uniref:Uncharacterized protein n=1 Tax=Mycobacterium phage Amgine TaxID=2015817 RepID=A0A222ZMP9_9CAUD|nr:hypothetical protein I5G84_gp58 [Mycobacterium phage Amgine]ASR85659.1 hypothetical protein SEA_AMGINE_58 [Mycobacterium phage Amgine]